jgi:hypothetical protein
MIRDDRSVIRHTDFGTATVVGQPVSPDDSAKD